MEHKSPGIAARGWGVPRSLSGYVARRCLTLTQPVHTKSSTQHSVGIVGQRFDVHRNLDRLLGAAGIGAGLGSPRDFSGLVEQAAYLFQKIGNDGVGGFWGHEPMTKRVRGRQSSTK